MMQRREVLSLGSVVALGAVSGTFADTAKAQDVDTLDGTWEGLLTQIRGEGLYERSFPPQRYRLVLQGNSGQVFYFRDDNPTELKPGQFQMQRHMTNALLSAINSGRDEAGVWVETQAWLLAPKSQSILGVMFSRVISNTSLPLDDRLSRIFHVSTGDFNRLS